MQTDVIRRLKISATSEGVDATTGKLRQLSGAQNDVAVMSERTSRASLSVERAYESLQRRVDPLYRAEQQRLAVMRTLDAAQSQGLVSSSRASQLLSLQASASEASASRTRLLAGEISSLARFTLSGGDPFMILAGSADKFAKLMKGGGLSTVLKGAFSALLAPELLIPLAFVGAGLAVTSFFGSINSGANSSAEALKKHEDQVKRIKDAYDIADKSARDFFDKQHQQTVLDQTVALRQQTKAVEDFQHRLQAQVEVQRNLKRPFAADYGGLLTATTVDQVDLLEERVSALALKTPALESLAQSFRHDADALKELLGLRGETQAMIDTLNGARPEPDKFAIGIATADLRAQLLHTKPPAGFSGDWGKPAGEAAKEAERLRKTFDDAVASAHKQTEALRDQALTFGMGSGAVAEFTVRQELLNAARENHVALTPAVIDSIEREAAAYGKTTSELERLQAQQHAADFLAQSFYDAARGASSLTDAVGRLGLKIAEAVLQASLLGQGPLSGLFGTSGGGGLLGTLAQAAIGAFTGGAGTAITNVPMPRLRPAIVGHTGGIVGEDIDTMRLVHPSYFDNAPRYHAGGMAGLMPDEVPAILQRGERVLPRGADAGGSKVIFQVIDQRSGGAPIEQRREVGPNGETIVRAIVRDELAKGGGDEALRQRYGARRNFARLIGGGGS